MNNRIWWALGVSLIAHIISLLVLPGPNPITPKTQKPDSIQVNLAPKPSSPRTPPRPKPEPEKKIQKPRKKPKDKTPKPPKPTPEKNKETKSTKNKESTDENKKERPESSASSSDDQNKTPEQTSSPSTTTEAEKNQSSNEPSLLKRGGQFSALNRKKDDRSSSNRKRTQLSTQTSSKQIEVKSDASGDTGYWKIPINEPGVQSTSRKKNVQFQLNVTQKADQISIKDWTRAKEKNPGPTDQRRKILKQPLPEMPDWLEQAGEEVKVTVHFTIQPNGSVDEMEILSSSGYTELDDKVLRSVRNWKYESSTNPEDHVVQFQFKLQPGNEP